jgi:SAM-dependent methyltransferase
MSRPVAKSLEIPPLPESTNNNSTILIPNATNFLSMGLELDQPLSWIALWDKHAARKQLPSFDMGAPCPFIAHLLNTVRIILHNTTEHISPQDMELVNCIPLPFEGAMHGDDQHIVTDDIKKPCLRIKTVNVLVPGCGSGYDLVEFAKSGYRVTGIDVSKIALNRAKQVCKDGRLFGIYNNENSELSSREWECWEEYTNTRG